MATEASQNSSHTLCDTGFKHNITQCAIFLGGGIVSLHMFQDSDKSWNCSMSGSPIKIIASSGLFSL